MRVYRVAWLGLGTMGAPMAENVARAGIPLVVYNRTPGRAAALRYAGVDVAASPAEAASRADVVVTILTGADAVEQVLFGPSGAATDVIENKLFVDMSTSGPRAALSIAARLAQCGARFVDAPISGTRGPAQAGELVVFAGGHEQDISQLAPLFAAIGKTTLHTGPVGSGQTLKVIYNGLGCQHLMAFATMLRLGERAGLSRQVLIDAFTTGAFATPAYIGKRSRVAERRYDGPDFVLALVLRDAELCAELQRQLGLELLTHAAAHREVARAVAAGLGELDLFGVERLYDELETAGP